MTTTTDQEMPEQTKGKSEHYPLFEVARKVLLASIGAAALAQEEIEVFIKRLIERGEIAEKDGHRLLQEVREKRKKFAASMAEKAEERITKRIENSLTRLNMPTREDIDALNQKIAALSKKIDQLKKT